MAENYFTPAAYGEMSVSSESSSVSIPGSAETTLRVYNSGPSTVVIALNTSGAAITPSQGVAIGPNQTEFLGIGSNTKISAILIDSSNPVSSLLNLASGV